LLWYSTILKIPLNRAGVHAIIIIVIIIIIIIIVVFAYVRDCTIIYLKQNMFLGYIVLQLFCIYSLCYM